MERKTEQKQKHINTHIQSLSILLYCKGNIDSSFLKWGIITSLHTWSNISLLTRPIWEWYWIKLLEQYQRGHFLLSAIFYNSNFRTVLTFLLMNKPQFKKLLLWLPSLSISCQHWGVVVAPKLTSDPTRISVSNSHKTKKVRVFWSGSCSVWTEN